MLNALVLPVHAIWQVSVRAMRYAQSATSDPNSKSVQA